jgi:hypothetical protein
VTDPTPRPSNKVTLARGLFLIGLGAALLAVFYWANNPHTLRWNDWVYMAVVVGVVRYVAGTLSWPRPPTARKQDDS